MREITITQDGSPNQLRTRRLLRTLRQVVGAVIWATLHRREWIAYSDENGFQFDVSWDEGGVPEDVWLEEIERHSRVELP